MTDREFSNFPDAFDFCRECNRPVIVIIAGERWKLFPSGRAVRLGTVSLADLVNALKGLLEYYDSGIEWGYSEGWLDEAEYKDAKERGRQAEALVREVEK